MLNQCFLQNNLKLANKNNEIRSNNIDVEFLNSLEKILDKQFSPLVNIVLKKLDNNERYLIECEKYQYIQSEWTDVAIISDHFLCYFFCIFTVLTCFFIFFESPHIFSNW